jgi:ABC-2 type transport system permease protein
MSNRPGKYIVLVQRELWEHASLWRVPAILFALVVLANLVFTNMFQFVQYTPEGVQSVVVTGALGSVSSIVFLVFVFLALFYLLDCLFAERKEKSILFWRSLPVSDTEAVLAKVFVAAVVIPLIIWITITAAHVTTLVIQGISGAEQAGAFMGVLNLGKYWLNLLMVLFATVLWCLPLMCWFLFCSSWTHRTPLVMSLAIPVAVSLVDRILSLNIGIGAMMWERIPIGIGSGDLTHGSDLKYLLGLAGLGFNTAGEAGMSRYGTFLLLPSLWGGLLVAAILITATIWVRRWRDDG